MKKALVFIPILCTLTSCIFFNDPTHNEAKKQFMQYGSVGRNSSDQIYFCFSERFASTSDYYGDAFFFYFEEDDFFRLAASFNVYVNDDYWSDGLVVADFKWKRYKSATHIFTMELYQASTDSKDPMYKIEYTNLKIQRDELAEDYKYKVKYTYLDDSSNVSNDTIEGGFWLIERAFEFGKTIVNDYNLDYFF